MSKNLKKRLKMYTSTLLDREYDSRITQSIANNKSTQHAYHSWSNIKFTIVGADQQLLLRFIVDDVIHAHLTYTL